MANSNTVLGVAKTEKKDEFYTRLSDIEREVRHYKKHFKDKVVLCNCDDPFESNFFKYFVLNFKKLGLKKLIATCYSTSPIRGSHFDYTVDVNGQMSFFVETDSKALLIDRNANSKEKKPYKAIVTTVYDKTGDGGIDMVDIAELFKSGENKLEELSGDGDFRSQECLDILAEADIVVTNPPFSLFREYVNALIKYEKKFLIIGHQNAIKYSDIFPLIKGNKMWLGYGFQGNVGFFESPYEDTAVSSQHKEGLIRVSGVMWFTNMDIKKRHEDMILVKRYDPKVYGRYINYDGIDVSNSNNIPCDYEGKMGVPITFMDKYNPEQFEIIGVSNVNGLLDDVEIIGEKWISDYKASGGTGHITANMHSLVGYKEDGTPASYYTRIIIRNKKPEKAIEVNV